MNVFTVLLTAPKNCKRCICRYWVGWKIGFSWCKLVCANQFVAECILCHKTFSITQRGRSDVLQHSSKKCNKNAARAAKTARIQTLFIKQAPSGLDKQVGHLSAFSSVNLNLLLLAGVIDPVTVNIANRLLFRSPET